MKNYVARLVCFDDYPDAFVPEMWAHESLAILEENQVMASLVHRDFSNEVQNFGDVVNTRRPGEFYATRKSADDDIVTQAPTATNVAVPLDQHIYQSFIIKDSDNSKSFLDLTDMYLAPNAQKIAQQIDRILLARTVDFMANISGNLNGLTAINAKANLLATRNKMNQNLCPVMGRNIVYTPDSETAMLGTDMFVAANTRGDGGTALENAVLGRVLGFQHFMDQNTCGWDKTSTDYASGTVTGAKVAGSTAANTVVITGYEVIPGEYAYIVGEDRVQRVSAATASTDTTSVTFEDAFVNGCEAGAVIQVMKNYDVNGTYAAGYQKYIKVDGWTTSPSVGQIITIGSYDYMIIEAVADADAPTTVTRITLDRPLAAIVTDEDPVFPLPYGNYNLAFTRNAIAFVNRPLALPRQSTGVDAAFADYNNLSIRITMQYSAIKQGTITTMDMLAGVKTLDVNQGCVLLG